MSHGGALPYNWMIENSVAAATAGSLAAEPHHFLQVFRTEAVRTPCTSPRGRLPATSLLHAAHHHPGLTMHRSHSLRVAGAVTEHRHTMRCRAFPCMPVEAQTEALRGVWRGRRCCPTPTAR